MIEVEGKPVVAIMLSGGVESTALVQHALNEGYYPICHFDARFANVAPHTPHVKAIATLYGVELYRLSLEENPFNRNFNPTQTTCHYWAGYGVMLATAYPDIDYFWVGANSGVREVGDIVDDPDPVALYGKSLSLIEQASVMAGGHAKAYMPLWRLTKKQQWDMIPEEIQSHIVTCEHQQWFGAPRCGECKKCVELRSIHEEEAYSEFCH